MISTIRHWASSFLVLLSICLLLGLTPIGVFACGWGFSTDQLATDPCEHHELVVETAVFSITNFLSTAFAPTTNQLPLLTTTILALFSIPILALQSITLLPLTPPPRLVTQKPRQ